MKLILFDIDGTLLKGAGGGREATRRAMLEVFGTESTLSQHNFGGKTDWFTLVELLTAFGYDEASIWHKMPVYERALAHHMNEVMMEIRPYALPGAVEVVETLRARSDVVLGIVTGNLSSTAPIKLQAAGFDPEWFPVGAYGSEAMDRDDLPSLALQRAVAYSGCYIAPRNTIVIGDTVRDIECARALGARVICVLTGFDKREDLEAASPDALIDDLTQLFEVFPG